MPNTIFKISPKTIGIVAALVVPMLLIPTSGHAGPARSDWSFLTQPIKVKQGYGSPYKQKSDSSTLREYFDNPAPRAYKEERRSRSKKMKRSKHRQSNRSRKSRRHSYNDGYYEDEFATSCVTPRQLHRRLKRQGWRNFHNLRIRSKVLKLKARQSHQGYRAGELTYNLRIDRCSGALLKARLQFRDRWYLRWFRQLSSVYKGRQYQR